VPEELINGCLPSLGNTNVNVKHDGSLEEGNGLVMGGNSVYMDYCDVEFGMIGVNGVVMSDKGEDKSWMLKVEIKTNR
jgi:hypothetical protein